MSKKALSSSASTSWGTHWSRTSDCPAGSSAVRSGSLRRMCPASVCSEILAAVLCSCIHIFFIASRAILRSSCFARVLGLDPVPATKRLLCAGFVFPQEDHTEEQICRVCQQSSRVRRGSPVTPSSLVVPWRFTSPFNCRLAHRAVPVTPKALDRP